MRTIVIEAANDQVPVTIDGKKRKITKLQATAIKLATDAATGNTKLVLSSSTFSGHRSARGRCATCAYPVSEVDMKVINEIYKRLRPYDGQVDD